MHPPITECTDRLIKKPPTSRREAVLFFSYFSARLGELGVANLAKLGNAPIVPIADSQKTSSSLLNEKAPETTRMKYLTPRQCYLGNSPTYNDIFDFVDFGNEANAFLMKCGSKDEPTKKELAALVCQEPARLLGIMQSPEKYLQLLRRLADDLAMLKKDKVLFKQMRASKFLLGSKEIAGTKEKPKSSSLLDDGDSDLEGLEDAPVKQWQLALPGSLVVVDDYNSYQLFKEHLVCAPLEDRLEEFYLALGSSNLSDIVQEDLRVGHATASQGDAAKLRKHVLERAKLFLHESPRENVKRDSRWLENNLSVQIVTGIQLRRSLRGQNLSNTEKRSAACVQERGRGLNLLVTAGYDTYQISQAMCKHLLDRPQQQSYLTFETFLTLSLYQLRSRGYNVERILRAKAAEARIAEAERERQLEAEQQHIMEQEENWRQQQQQQQQQTPAIAAAAREESRRDSQIVSMPGGFGPDSPENSPPPARKPKTRGLFSNLTRRLGIDSGSNDDASRSPSTSEDVGKDTPPPYQEIDTKDKEPPTEKVTSPAAIQQNLLNAIKSSRAHDSSKLFTQPNTTTVKEQATYCDSNSGHNINFLADASNGTRIFVTKTMTDPSAFLSSNASSLNTFANLLHEAADVYSLPRTAIHIFHEDGNTIAFNANGSIFCNFRFYAQLHQRKMESGLGAEKAEVGAYWWVVLAHELAHNLVKPHNSDHSFYT
jgi:hypothetical protein